MGRRGGPWTTESRTCAPSFKRFPEPVMLDFMQPKWPAGRGGGLSWEARRDETQHAGFLNTSTAGVESDERR